MVDKKLNIPSIPLSRVTDGEVEKVMKSGTVLETSLPSLLSVPSTGWSLGALASTAVGEKFPSIGGRLQDLQVGEIK